MANEILGSSMTAELMQTPTANRLHIGFFGRRNSGKSSLLNAFCGQEVVIVSDVAGTTTDPVLKNMEISGLGPCTLIDTAGYDDEGQLGTKRVEKTKQAALMTDIAILVFTSENEADGLDWWRYFKESGKPCLPVVSKADLVQSKTIADHYETLLGERPLEVSAKTKDGLAEIRNRLIEKMPADFEMPSLIGHMVRAGDVVLLVMPQDLQAPKGRLILPQVQTIRDLLDHQAIVVSTVLSQLDKTLKSLINAPALIITDSQVFAEVYQLKPEESKLTSFSVLMAAYKGDISAYLKGADALDYLTEQSKVLIAECCTHAPLEEDIGRVKIPNLLKKKYGSHLSIDILSGKDYPKDLTKYDLIIQCGACMFNRRYVLSRIQQAEEQGVAISNYGIILAKLKGILEKISID